ncbi:hypothetical protein HOG17_03935 [Candidatus Peregrinibacteria bacterium]|jgi:DNA transformation protein and related proteins|nr:hypothetical protein [Candidatus Peregrinibacteria bacterium]MBT4148354.1 hypothetical protein [Candidatus Peregrinibacteria bacterium]MBT4366679.1 hypothetical protein [Candidatus Peregrinibacteria bacterium]MBT4455893.1 hypothetical protein [Candidatus Peregrinibacteria bacterium]
MSQELESLPNIGKKIAEKLHKIGINDVDEFMENDPYEMFIRLKLKVEPTLCRCALASIVGAKEGIVWHKIHKKSAEELERRYPELKWKNKC